MSKSKSERIPVVKKRRRGQRWQIYWWWRQTMYAVSAGIESENLAEQERARLQVTLETGEWLESDLRFPAVQRFLRRQTKPSSSARALEYYHKLRLGEICPRWAQIEHAYLRQCSDYVDGAFLQMGPDEAREFIAQITQTPGPVRRNQGPRSVCTRNQMLTVCKAFFRWAVQTKRAPLNPFLGVPTMQEPDVEEITYCVRAERDRLLEAVEARPNALAVWLAFHTGMRRGASDGVTTTGTAD